jgi:hypothetical protein
MEGFERIKIIEGFLKVRSAAFLKLDVKPIQCPDFVISAYFIEVKNVDGLEPSSPIKYQIDIFPISENSKEPNFHQIFQIAEDGNLSCIVTRTRFPVSVFVACPQEDKNEESSRKEQADNFLHLASTHARPFIRPANHDKWFDEPSKAYSLGR